ncbi:MAG: translation initiation factor IF-5A [Candidatus Pacearchaeota archaeon]|nr:translation initiation factor IF-5A [Candidatus Pacearchaeota archaeon]
MVLKLIDAYDAKPGTIIMLDGEACSVISNDISKSGKHGASKCRIEAKSVITGKKKVIACPGSERFEVPMIEKKKAQVLSVSESTASIMDLESYETIDLPFIEGIKNELVPEKQVEYWDIEGKKIIMRIL